MQEPLALVQPVALPWANEHGLFEDPGRPAPREPDLGDEQQLFGEARRSSGASSAVVRQECVVHACAVPGSRQHPEGDARFPVRRAVVEDARAIAEFQTSCWRTAYAELVPQAYLERVGVVEREVRWRDRLRTGARSVALAEDAGDVIGVVSWSMTPIRDAPALQLASVYVSSARQGAGLGGRLLRHAVREEPAHLWVFADNLRARDFYRRHGFVAEGRQATDTDTGLVELLYVRR